MDSASFDIDEDKESIMLNRQPRALLAALTVLTLAVMPAGLLAKKALFAPTFEAAASKPGLFQLLPSSVDHPEGVGELILHAEVGNPNEVPLTLEKLDGTLRLNGHRTAAIAMPLGLELQPNGKGVITLRLKGYFGQLPELANLMDRSPDGTWIDYEVEGRVATSSADLGETTFGPTELWSGKVQVKRWAKS